MTVFCPSGVARFLAVVVLCGAPATALADPPDPPVTNYSEIASAFDVHVSVDYRFELGHTNIRREAAGLPGTDPDGPLPIVDDLVADSTRHIITPRLAFGIFDDVEVSAELPVIIGWRRQLSLADGIDRGHSTTVADGILPATGYDADDPGGPGLPTSEATLFRGPSRAGIDQLIAGLTWAAMNEARDPTKPTWKLGAELRLAIGEPMRFDREDPGTNTGVGRGVHEVRVATSVAKHTSWSIPYIEVYWLAPIATRDDALFDDLGFGQTSADLQQHAGAHYGFTSVLWRDPSEAQSVGIQARGSVDVAFEGRAYTDIWEMLAYAGDTRTGGPLILDRDPVQDGVQALSHPGISNVENYLTLGGGLGIHADLGETVRFSAGVDVIFAQAHAITFADAGTDSDDPGTLIDRGTAEVNPFAVPTIDLTGHRYRAEGGITARFGITARALF